MAPRMTRYESDSFDRPRFFFLTCASGPLILPMYGSWTRRALWANTVLGRGFDGGVPWRRSAFRTWRWFLPSRVARRRKIPIRTCPRLSPIRVWGGGNVSSAQVHDLGVIFAQGQTLRHEFTLKNESKRPLRLIGAAALTPCCSSIGPLPGSIPPTGEVKVPVSFKPGYRSGLKAVLFTVQTDEKERPVRTLALQARLVSAFEMQPLEGSTTSVALGQSGRQTFLLTARRKGNQGRSLPEKLSVSSPLEVAFRGKAATKSDADGLVEASREMIVTIPAEKQAGSRGGGVTFS